MMRCPAGLEKFRVRLAGELGDDSNGIIDWKPEGLRIQFSNGFGWEHVSVSRRKRMPTYEDMDKVKRLFWCDDETVMQLHVDRADHVNCHPYCLHLWRPIGVEIPRPPSILVGV